MIFFLGGGRGDHIFIFLSVAFFGRIDLKLIEEQKYDSRGVRGHAHQESFSKFRCCNGHFSAFGTILMQI